MFEGVLELVKVRPVAGLIIFLTCSAVCAGLFDVGEVHKPASQCEYGLEWATSYAFKCAEAPDGE